MNITVTDGGIQMTFKKEKLPARFQNKIETDLAYLLGRDIPGLVQICLFGSVARGDYKWDSDIDLAIITEAPLTDHSLRGEIIDVLDEELDGVSTDIVFRTKDNNKSLSNTFDKLYERDKVILWEK